MYAMISSALTPVKYTPMFNHRNLIFAHLSHVHSSATLFPRHLGDISVQIMGVSPFQVHVVILKKHFVSDLNSGMSSFQGGPQ